MSELSAAIATVAIVGLGGTIGVLFVVPRMTDPLDRPGDWPERQRRIKRDVLILSWLVVLASTAIALWIQRSS